MSFAQSVREYVALLFSTTLFVVTGLWVFFSLSLFITGLQEEEPYEVVLGLVSFIVSVTTLLWGLK